MKKRFLILIIGFLSLKLSIDSFPALKNFTVEVMMHHLVYQPFKWFSSILLFVIGFFVLSRFIKEVFENISVNRKRHKEVPWIFVLLVGFVIIALENIWVALLALGISFFYGIMDANVRNLNRYYLK